MRKHKVYLAGPITGLSYAEGQDWRDVAKNALSEMGIEGYSPLRSKQYLSKLEVIPALPKTNKPMSTSRGIITRDYHDVLTADAILVNLLGPKTVSIGTVMEIAWGYQLRKPMVLIMEPDSIHEHPFIVESVGYRVETLQDGVDIIGNILLP